MRSTDPIDYQTVPRPIAAMAKSFPDGARIAPHHHPRAQFIHAVTGTMTVSTDGGTWLVPPDRALWMPGGVVHAIDIAGEVDMRTVYVRHDVSASSPDACRVVAVSPLLKALIVRATERPLLYDEASPDAAVATLIVAEIRAAPTLPLHLPMPHDRRLRHLCRLVLADLGAADSREDYAARVGISERSLSRLMRQQTGLGFGQWRQQARLLAALGRLGAGEPVKSVALALGYGSASAFTAMFRRSFGGAPASVRERGRSRL